MTKMLTRSLKIGLENYFYQNIQSYATNPEKITISNEKFNENILRITHPNRNLNIKLVWLLYLHECYAAILGTSKFASAAPATSFCLVALANDRRAVTGGLIWRR